MVNFNLSNRTPIFHAIRVRAMENWRLVVAARRQTAANFQKSGIFRLSAESRHDA
jgi:hypothetical protein